MADIKEVPDRYYVTFTLRYTRHNPSYQPFDHFYQDVGYQSRKLTTFSERSLNIFQSSHIFCFSYYSLCRSHNLFYFNFESF